MLCGAPFCCEACLLFSNDLLRLWLQSVQYDLQHDFAWVTNETGRSLVLALLPPVILGKCDDQGLGPRGWPFPCLKNLGAECRDRCNYLFSTCLDQFCWDVVNSSRLPFLQWLYWSLHFFAKDGVVVLCVCLVTVQYWWISIGLVIIQLRAVFSPSVQYLSFFCEEFSWKILDSNSFSLFHSGEVFHEFVCSLIVVLPQFFFNLITLFSYLVFLSIFHVPPNFIILFPIFLRSFRFESFLSLFFPFVAQI